jgi:hypothetical protein
MSIKLGDVTLFYKITETASVKYITTFINDNPILDEFILFLATFIVPFYSTRYIKRVNACDSNSKFLCEELNEKMELNDKIAVGRLIIINWDIDNQQLNEIKKKYGETSHSIGRTHHVLLYININIEDTIYCIAVETIPFLQFYVGTPTDFETIIKKRYQCQDYFITYDCDIPFQYVVYTESKEDPESKGGKYHKRRIKQFSRHKHLNRTKRIRKKIRQRI